MAAVASPTAGRPSGYPEFIHGLLDAESGQNSSGRKCRGPDQPRGVGLPRFAEVLEAGAVVPANAEQLEPSEAVLEGLRQSFS